MANEAARRMESAPAPARRRRNGTQSRKLLLESALKLLSKGKAPTSVNITKAAGLAQPTFYAHFKSVDACLLAAAEYVQARVDDRRSAWRNYHPAGSGPLHREALLRAVSDWLEASRTTGAMLDALARFRDDETPLGDLVRDIHGGMVHQMAGEFFGVAEACGVAAEHRQSFVILAELHTAAVTAMSQLVNDSKVGSVAEGATILADNLGATLRRTIESAGGDAARLSEIGGW